MLFCQVWIARRATRYNLTKPQTFPLEKPRGLNSGLRCTLVFWMSLYKDYMMSSTKSRGVGTSDSPRTRRVQRNGHSVHASHGKSKSIMNWIKKEQNQN